MAQRLHHRRTDCGGGLVRSVKHMRWCTWLVDTRTGKGMTQEAAAASCGVPLKTYQSWEQGVRYPHRQQRVALCRGLGLDPLDDHWLSR